MILEKLDTPKLVPVKLGDGTIVQVSVTHRYWGRNDHPWSDKVPLRSFCVYAVEENDGAGKKKLTVIPGSEDSYDFTPGDVVKLRAPEANGKRQDQYRNVDVINFHKFKKNIP